MDARDSVAAPEWPDDDFWPDDSVTVAVARPKRKSQDLLKELKMDLDDWPDSDLDEPPQPSPTKARPKRKSHDLLKELKMDLDDWPDDGPDSPVSATSRTGLLGAPAEDVWPDEDGPTTAPKSEWPDSDDDIFKF